MTGVGSLCKKVEQEVDLQKTLFWQNERFQEIKTYTVSPWRRPTLPESIIETIVTERLSTFACVQVTELPLSDEFYGKWCQAPLDGWTVCAFDFHKQHVEIFPLRDASRAKHSTCCFGRDGRYIEVRSWLTCALGTYHINHLTTDLGETSMCILNHLPGGLVWNGGKIAGDKISFIHVA